MCMFYRCRTSVSINVSIVESHFLKAADSVARVELGRLFHQLGTVKVKVQESNFVLFTCKPQASGVHIRLKSFV